MSEDTDGIRARYIDPTEEQGRLLFTSGIEGPVTMLNLLRFRAVADYSAHPDLAPSTPISGKWAYQLYADHTMPYLAAVGGSVTLAGDARPFLIGPTAQRWDLVLLVTHTGLGAFLSMATDAGYLSGIGHREAALED